MSPTSLSSSTIYDHLVVNYPEKPQIMTRNHVLSVMTSQDDSPPSVPPTLKPECNRSFTLKKRKPLSADEQLRRHTVTNINLSNPSLRCSVSNQTYAQIPLQKSIRKSNISATLKEKSSRSTRPPLTSNIEVKPMDFRPLIINGRRRFNTISTGTPMVIIKKKSPSPMNNFNRDQKVLPCSIPVNVTSNNNTPMVVSTVIPSSLSYSSSCTASATPESLRKRTPISVPIQITKTKENNHHTQTNGVSTTTINNNNNHHQQQQHPNIINGSPRGYRYIQKQPQYLSPPTSTRTKNNIQPLTPSSDNDYDDIEAIATELAKAPTSSSTSRDVNDHFSTNMTDSHVLRLIRRYDPSSTNSTTDSRNKTGRSLQSTRGIWHTVTPNSLSSMPSHVSTSLRSVVPQRALSTADENFEPARQSSMPRLQRQQAVYEQEPLSSPSTPNPNQTFPKYTLPPSQTDLAVRSNKTEPLRIEIDPPVPPTVMKTNGTTNTYQPLITTGTKRVCAAISKSERDLRLQLESYSPTTPPSPTACPVRPPSPRIRINEQQGKESYRPLLGRSISTMGINNNEENTEIDDFDENSAPIINGSSIRKLQQLFTPKSSIDSSTALLNKQHRIDSVESNLNRSLNTNDIKLNNNELFSSTASLAPTLPNSISTETQKHPLSNGTITKPTTIVQESLSTPTLIKRPILRSHKTIDSTESLNRLNQRNQMPASELSHEAYRFRRLNDHDQMTNSTTRLRNVAKVEPYSINTTMNRPLYQASSTQMTARNISPPPRTTSASAKARIILNSVGNTPTNTSTSSSAASLGGVIRHQNVRQSDFLVPNPSYSTPAAKTITVPTPPPSHTFQPFSSSSSYPAPQSTSMSSSHGPSHQLSNNNNKTLLYNGRSASVASSVNPTQQKYRPSTKIDLYQAKEVNPSSAYQNGNSTIISNNNTYEQFDNYPLPSSYHYRPKEFASSTTAINASLNNAHQPSQGSLRSTLADQQQQQDERILGGQQQSRRRFQRRKQMKRSKSADLYQGPLSPSNSTIQNNNSYFYPPTHNNEENKINRQPRSTSRDLITGGDGNLSASSSSSSSSSIAHIERINRDTLLRYKSLDSMTFNNRKLNLPIKCNNQNANTRRAVSKPTNIDFDSDDSVCGIPKPRKLCTTSKTNGISDKSLPIFSSPEEKDRSLHTRAISNYDIGNSGTSTRFKNPIHQDEITTDQTSRLVETSLPVQLSTIKITNSKQREQNLMEHEQETGSSLIDSRLCAQTSGTPTTKRRNLIYSRSEEIYSTPPPMDDVFHDAVDNFNTNQDQTDMPTKIFTDWNRPFENKHTPKPVQNQELYIRESTDVTIPITSSKPKEFSPTLSFTRPLKSSIEKLQQKMDNNNDSTSISTANRSIYLPIEKQRGLSEIIRKRNSRYKVEDYKRSIQKSSTFDEQQSQYFRSLSARDNSQANTNSHSSSSTQSLRQIRPFSKTQSMDFSYEYDQPSFSSTGRFPSNEKIYEEQNSNEQNEFDDKIDVSARRNLFETFSKDSPIARSLIRSKSFKEKSFSSFNERYAVPVKSQDDIKQDSSIGQECVPNENSLGDNSSEVFDDDTSKLSFKEKMVLFNKKKNNNSTTSSSSKTNRSRLTQPITADEVLAAEHFSTDTSPTSSLKQLETSPPGNDKSLMHDSLSFSLNSSFEDQIFAKKPILQTTVLQENCPSEEHVSELIMHEPEDTNMLSPEEAENMIPVSKRLEQLKTYGETEWKKRVKSTNDANEFTVEGKLRQAGKLSTPTDEQKSLPSSTRKTPTLKYGARKTNNDNEQRAKTVDVVRLKAESIGNNKDTKQTSSNSKTNETKSTTNKANVVSVLKSDTISVLKPDDHLDDFFGDTNKNLNNDTSVQLNTDDLNRIAENAVRLQSQPARVRPPRRQQQGAKNPLRQIQATVPTATEYTEVHTNISEQELRRLKRAQIAENAGLAQEALAALAATENFAEINLRKIDRSAVATFGYEPYKDVMLILIKGRRHCSLRLVNPIFDSVNEGDCYLLITPSKVFAWLGHYANTLEKAKTMDMIDFLKQQRDFGLRSEVKYFILDQANDDTETDIYAEFADILHGDDENFKSMDLVTDDDYFEANVMELNRVYRLDNDMLIPLDDFCFRSLSVKILDPNEVFVFDFGSELYVWNGKYADKNKRNVGLQLAQQLWNDPYDFSECLINPFEPLDDKNESGGQTGTKRPTWCVFGKQNQNVETLLFKGKFYDWPGDLKELKPVNDAANNVNRIPSARRPPSIVEMLKPADVQKMLARQDNPVNMILEQANLGRGKHWYDPVELRGHDVQTISLNVWHVSDNERHEVNKSSYGQFHTDDVYIIRWRYKLVASGFHSITTGKASVRKTDTGRDRVAYWIWQGVNASPNEKGISALMTVFLDEEKGPHIHVNQDHEEATFLQLFDGTLTIHMGKRNQSNPTRTSPWHLYVFLGEIDVETHWWELNLNNANLRSRTSFLLINNIANIMILWHGCGTTNEQKTLANKSTMKIRERRPDEFHFNDKHEYIEFNEMQEGDETDLFWDIFPESNHQRKYFSLLNTRTVTSLTATMRIFHLSSLHGPFVAQEIQYLLRSPNHISAFPFTQADLYDLQQPALCLVDAHSEIFIWQGWNDLSDDELDVQLNNANIQAGAPNDLRFTAERRCALRTVVEYCKAKTGSSTVDLPCSIVYAGLEPIEFINLFPKWTVHMKARQQNQLEGKSVNQKDSVPDILKKLCREQYTIEELRARPLPEGVDPSKIESYLSDEDFQKEFRMTKDEYYALPYWKQTNIKKPLGFF